MRITRVKYAASLMMVIILAFAVSALPEENEQTTGVHVGELAPDFTLPTIEADEDPVNLYEQIEQHDVVLLYFFFAAT